MRYLFIPKSYSARHKVLSVLFEQSVEGHKKSEDPKDRCLTKDEIVQKSGLPSELVDQQLDYLYATKDIEVVFPDKIHKYIIMPAGMKTLADKTFLNEGKLLNSQIINNYANTIFQGIVAILALVAIVQSFTTISDLKEANGKLTQEVSHISKELRQLRLDAQTQKNAFDTKVSHQTNPESDSAKK